ncbi:hypothetical protein [Sinomonas gamaensis]|uniref:hypothetical protein n=1 Tax=Sinomonas gamaensis TaxID=2565624 RepID=UPI0014864605|nr:hypothetical protein [Sinomonas gamaensis]
MVGFPGLDDLGRKGLVYLVSVQLKFGVLLPGPLKQICGSGACRWRRGRDDHRPEEGDLGFGVLGGGELAADRPARGLTVLDEGDRDILRAARRAD